MPFFENGTWYPYETISGNATTFIDIMNHANTLTNDLFGIMMLGAIFLILFVAMSSRDSDTALASASFVTAILSILLAAADVIADFISIGMIFVTIGAIIMLYRGGNKNV